MKRECGSCEFFEAGMCKRMPPVMVPWPSDNQHPVLYMPAPSYPSVQVNDWCGEYRLADELRRTGTRITADHPLAKAARAEDMPLA